MRQLTNADVSVLVEFLEKYGAPLSFEYLGVLMNFDELLDEVVSLVDSLPEDINLEGGFTVEETVSFDDPMMPNEFYDAGLEDELSELFWDIVNWDYRDFFNSFNNYEYFDKSNEIERVAYEIFNSVDYVDTYGIRNYYRMYFTLPGIAEIIEDAYHDDDVWQALEYVVEGIINHRRRSDVQNMIDVATMLRALNLTEVKPEEIKELRKKILSLCPDLVLSFKVYDEVEEFMEDVAAEMHDKLKNSILKPLLILKRYLPQAVEYYAKYYDAIRHTCRLFEQYASELMKQFEDIEYWKEYFEINERYDILAKLFPADKRYQQVPVN